VTPVRSNRRCTARRPATTTRSFDEAAALLESLLQNHPFVDGTKRVAFAVVDVFLRINGFTITASSTAIYNRMINLVEERTFDMAHLVPWLQEVVELVKQAR
jgi:death on curing protein